MQPLYLIIQHKIRTYKLVRDVQRFDSEIPVRIEYNSTIRWSFGMRILLIR